MKDNFRYPTPPFLSGDWPLRSLTRLTGPTYSPVIPCLIYSFQLLLGLSVVTLALHLVKLPLQGYQCPIRPMSLPTKSPGSPIIGVAASCAPKSESGAPGYAVWRTFTGRIGEANEPASFLQPSVEQVTSRIGRKQITMFPTTASGTLGYITIRYASK